MKRNFLIIGFLLAGLFINAQTNNIVGLWKIVDNVFDGSTNRLENLNLEISNDTIEFYYLDSIKAKGLLTNDTIFLLYGFEYYDIEWIYVVNNDYLISSTPNLESSNNLSFTRIDLTGDWEQLNYYWDGEVSRDTCKIIQEKDSIYFYASSDYFANAYIKRDSIIVIKGFEGIGIDFFSMYSNDSFDKFAPLTESIDRVLFIRLGQFVSINDIRENCSVQIFPNPIDDFIRIIANEKMIQEVKLYSLNGEIIKAKKVTNQSFDLNTFDLIKGIYILTIEFYDKKIIKKKILKK